MRFLVIRKADAETEAGVLPTEGLITAMLDYNTKLIESGHMKGGDGLKPSSKGARVKFHGGKPQVIDGPFAEAKELIAGYSVIEAGSLAEVVELVKGWPPLDGHGEVEIEIREVFTAADFGDAFTPELQARDAELRAREQQG